MQVRFFYLHLYGSIKRKKMAKVKSVRAQINELPVGQSVGFPLDRYDYAVNCKTRLQMGTDKKWTARIDRPSNQVFITRTN